MMERENKNISIIGSNSRFDFINVRFWLVHKIADMSLGQPCIGIK